VVVLARNCGRDSGTFPYDIVKLIFFPGLTQLCCFLGQSIGDTAATDANGKPVYNPGLIHTLKENRDKAIVGLVKEEASLRVDISTLEKERRHMHSLLLDLVYYIEQDSRHNASVINNVATSNMKTALPDALSANNNSVETVVPPIPPKSALKKVTKNLGKF
jgi:hypothetical protein